MDRLFLGQLVYIIPVKGGRQDSCANTEHYQLGVLAGVEFDGGR